MGWRDLFRILGCRRLAEVATNPRVLIRIDPDVRFVLSDVR